MKAWFIAACFVFVPGLALAQGRPSTTAMRCAEAQALVQRSGAIVIGTGGDTFDRAVRDLGFCAVGQKTRPLFAPTRDQPACYVGDRCFDEVQEPR